MAISCLLTIGASVSRWQIDFKTGLNLPSLIISHNNLCVQCNITITNFLVSHTCEIRFNDVTVKALYLCVPTRKFRNMADPHGEIRMF